MPQRNLKLLKNSWTTEKSNDSIELNLTSYENWHNVSYKDKHSHLSSKSHFDLLFELYKVMLA